MQQLAAAADRRWKAIPSFLDKPEDTGQAQPLLQPRDNAGYGNGQTQEDKHEGVANAAKSEEEHIASLKGEDVDKGRFKGETKEAEPTRTTDPWKAAQRGAAGEGWQPAAWQPGKSQRRG